MKRILLTTTVILVTRLTTAKMRSILPLLTALLLAPLAELHAAELAHNKPPAATQSEWRFDFGPASSPVAGGFVAVGRADGYEAARGYGWKVAPQEEFSRDTHWAGELPDSVKVMRDLPLDRLTRDGVASREPMVLRVDVPDGDYELYAWVGDYLEPAKSQVITANGQTLAGNVTAGVGGIWGQTLSAATLPVRGVCSVKGGALRVKFDSLNKDAKRAGIRAVGLQIRRHTPGLLRLEGRVLSWHGAAPDAEANGIADLINAGRFDDARRQLGSYRDGGGRFIKVCLLEALVGSLAQTDVRTCRALAQECVDLLRAPIDGVEVETQAEHRELATHFREACDGLLLMSYQKSAELTKKSRWRRFREGVNLALLVQPDEPLYWQAQFLAARLCINMGIEGNPEDTVVGRPIIERLFQQFPKHRLVRLYASKTLGKTPVMDEWRQRLGSTPGPAPEPPPPLKRYLVPDAEAPEWAVMQRGLLASISDIVNFWLKQRQVENGEIGGGFNDDVEILRRWGAIALAIDMPNVNAGIAKMADGVWESSPDLKAHGYTTALDDVEHAAEDVSDSQPLCMALNYGEPRFLLRCLLNSSHIENVWTGITPQGRRHFRSFFFGADQVDADPARGFDVQLSARAVKPALWAASYCREPRLMRVLEEWSESWVQAALESRGGKPAGLFPAGVRFADTTFPQPWHVVGSYADLAKTGMYDELMWEHLLGMWAITGKTRYLEPMHAAVPLMQTQASDEPGSAGWAAGVLRKPLLGRVATWRLMTGDQRHDDWLAKQAGTSLIGSLLGAADESRIVEELRAATLSNEQNFELLTHELLFTDRLFMKGHEQIATMYGGNAGISQFPSHSVRWENVSTDVSVWVRESTQKKFSARLYSFAERERSIAMQQWRLQPGRYRLSMRVEKPGSPELWQREVTLAHPGDSVPLSVASRQPLIVEMTQLETKPWDPSRLPDLAAEPAESKDGKLTFTLYNLGCGLVRDCRVSLRADGRDIETITVPTLAGLTGSTAGTATINFDNPTGKAGSLELVIDPQDAIPEITERNNRCLFRMKSRELK